MAELCPLQAKTVIRSLFDTYKLNKVILLTKFDGLVFIDHCLCFRVIFESRLEHIERRVVPPQVDLKSA